MIKKKIGDTVTFERYLGNWKITDIIEKPIKLKLCLNKIKCNNCGAIVGENKEYIFNYIEVLQEGKRKMHLGISEEGRYVILEEHLGFSNNIKEVINNATIN